MDDITTLRTLRDLDVRLKKLGAVLTIRHTGTVALFPAPSPGWLVLVAQDGYAIGSACEPDLLDSLRRALVEAETNQKILE